MFGRSSSAVVLLSWGLLGACSGEDTTTMSQGLQPVPVADVAPDAGSELAVSAPARPPAPAAGSVCALSADGVTTLERPMFPDREGSPTFGYSFKLYPGTDPDAATVIFLPGGPGQSGIEVTRNPGYAPLEYSLVSTDLRGIGCNAPESVEHYPDEFYRSVHFADDVVAIVEHLGLDNYLLYGVSYGTLLGTLVASRIEARGLPAPRALVLEGVLGTTFSRDLPGTEVAFQEQWRSVRDSLDESIRSQFSVEPLPLDLTPQQWGAGIQGTLPLGATPMTGGLSFLYVLLQSLAASATDEQRSAIRELMIELGEPPVDAMGERLHHVVTCHEIADTDFESLELDGDELQPAGIDCKDIPLSDAYAAAAWPVHVPIYYYSGTVDPNTPPWQAQAHFDAQTTAPRRLVHVVGGGHNPRAINLVDCQGPLWQAMATGSDFEAALATCSWPHELVSAAAATVLP